MLIGVRRATVGTNRAAPGLSRISLAALLRAGAQHAILNTGRVLFLGHPDALFQHNAVCAAQAVSKNGKAFFQTKGLQVDKASWIESSIPVLVRPQVVGTLVEKYLLIDF